MGLLILKSLHMRELLSHHKSLHNGTFGKTVEVPRVILHTDTLI